MFVTTSSFGPKALEFVRHLSQRVILIDGEKLADLMIEHNVGVRLALDDVGPMWHRNPSRGGFRIPLLSEGDTSSFYPDFMVWKKGGIFCLDTKGGHLLSDAVARKLFDIKEDGKTKLQVRFISEGKQSALREKPIKGGYTIWKMKSHPRPFISVRSKKRLESA